MYWSSHLSRPTGKLWSIIYLKTFRISCGKLVEQVRTLRIGIRAIWKFDNFWAGPPIFNLYVCSHSCNPSLPPIVEHSHILLIIINLPPFFSARWKYFVPSRFHKLLPWVLFWPLPLVNNGFNFFSGFSTPSAPNSRTRMSWSHIVSLKLLGLINCDNL